MNSNIIQLLTTRIYENVVSMLAALLFETLDLPINLALDSGNIHFLLFQHELVFIKQLLYLLLTERYKSGVALWHNMHTLICIHVYA
jgi:hypothetical protein